MPAERILILGGTREAADLAARMVAEGVAEVITSLAGRTREPAPVAGTVRIGGFGGAEGLARYLLDNGITRVIDATHPFAKNISANAVLACRSTGIALETIERPAWKLQPGDNWTRVVSLEQAAALLPPDCRPFLALGRQYLSAFEPRHDCHFVIRMVDPPATRLNFASHTLVLGKPAGAPSEEEDVFRLHDVTHLVCRNSGGAAGYAKIVAARNMGLPVVMIDRQ
ncbi:cobalt-precorrin-6A reductase [Rhizobiaceae bacterium n13]|uniref:Cobalt-precorrin-6A reductase n=1 Tax=Ferirhizobium litorale TaxID=2927786 RepID=A0AAE3U4Z6_9HYPH|nr:cobalt-precorrin-6A reductase [Fererhizobium litorale]MDI7863575.1 cobalt-precorrin-6A reductase [Fererhizobium litorale]MDI7923504.1 cobalt-precorrin-6A reductase [Fererhizobium litorale]